MWCARLPFLHKSVESIHAKEADKQATTRYEKKIKRGLTHTRRPKAWWSKVERKEQCKLYCHLGQIYLANKSKLTYKFFFFFLSLKKKINQEDGGLQSSSHASQSCKKPNLEVGAFIDIKILWCIYNRPIIHNQIFVIKLISNWWCKWSANEIKPCGSIKWRKRHGNVRRKD